jgi:hypothetical protein
MVRVDVHAQLRDVLKQTPAVICVTRGPRHLIEVVNDQFRDLVAVAEVVGKTVAEVLPGTDDEMTAAMTLAYETGVPQHGREVAVALCVEGAQPAMRIVTQTRGNRIFGLSEKKSREN